MKKIINTENGSVKYDLLRHANNGMKLYNKLLGKNVTDVQLLKIEIQVAYDLVSSGLI